MEINVMGNNLFFQNANIKKSKLEGIDIEKIAAQYSERINIAKNYVEFKGPFMFVPHVKQTSEVIETAVYLTMVVVGSFALLNSMMSKHPSELLGPIITASAILNYQLYRSSLKKPGIYFYKSIPELMFSNNNNPINGNLHIKTANLETMNTDRLVTVSTDLHPEQSVTSPSEIICDDVEQKIENEVSEQAENYPFKNSGIMELNSSSVFMNVFNSPSGFINAINTTFNSVKSYGTIELLECTMQKVTSCGVFNAKLTTFLDDLVICEGNAIIDSCKIKNLIVSGPLEGNKTKVSLTGETQISGSIIFQNEHVELSRI